MQVLKELKSIEKFPVFGVFIFFIIFGYVDYGCVAAISKFPSIVSEILTTDSAMIVLADIGFIVCMLFAGIVLAWFNAFIIYGFVVSIRLIGVSVTLLDKGIKIRGRSKEAFVPNSSITHISCSTNKRNLFIVWNGAKGVMSFFISSRTFGVEAVEEANMIFKERKAYVDDPKQALEIRKGITKFQGSILLPFKNPCDIEDGVAV